MTRNFAILVAAVVLATLHPVPAQADVVGDFIAPTGDVYCQMAQSADGSGSVACEGGGLYDAPRPDCASHSAWGDRFTLTQGQAPVANCHNDTIRSNQAAAPVLDYGQSRTVGQITCESRQYGIACTDAGTRHFFVMTADANTAG